MAKNDFSAEVAENYEEKCLCVLVLDLSGSMNNIVDETGMEYTGEKRYIDGKLCNIVTGGVSKLEKLEEGLKKFYNEIEHDAVTSQRLEISIIAFNDDVRTIQEPALIENIKYPTLEADGNTALVDAVYEAIDLVEARKRWYKSTSQKYYRPWIILMTDGEPNDGQDVASLSQRIKIDTSKENKRYVFLPIGVDNANMDTLVQIQGDIPAMKLKDAEFSKFFKWLSASMSSVVSAEQGQTIDLSTGAESWMSAFTI